MKKLFLLCAGLACLLTFSIIFGCGLQKSNVTYTVSVSSLSAALQTASFEVAADNSAVAGSYTIKTHGFAPSVTVSARNYYSTDSRFVTPRTTFNRVHVDYSVVTDSAGILTGWTPTSVDSATNIVIPRSASGGASGEASGSGEATATVVLNNITGQAHMADVGNRILTVNQTVSSGVYSYTLSLRTNLVVRATVTISGQDEYGNAVSTGFTADIQYTN